MAKKTYKVINLTAEDLASSASENTAGSTKAEAKPLLKIDGVNEQIITGGIYTLPDAGESEETTLEVVYRILGFPVKKENLAHLPQDVTSEHIDCLLSHYPFAYHKRFGDTYTDRVCPESTRTSKCPACTARKTLFTCDEYKTGVINKDQIMGAKFGTQQVAAFVARIFVDGNDLGVCATTTALTNPKSTMAKRDNLFDLISNMVGPKKLIASASLPVDYYANGDGARLLVAEYIRTPYSPKSNDDGEKTNHKAKVYHYWKLSKVSALEEIEGVGKAKEIWWPKVGKEDSADLVDMYALVNHTDLEELTEIATNSFNRVMSPQGVGMQPHPKAETKPVTKPDGDFVFPTWAELVKMNADQLVAVGIAAGGEEEALTLVGKANPAVLLRSVAKAAGITPTKVAPTKVESKTDDETGEEDCTRDDLEEGDDTDLPF